VESSSSFRGVVVVVVVVVIVGVGVVVMAGWSSPTAAGIGNKKLGVSAWLQLGAATGGGGGGGGWEEAGRAGQGRWWAWRMVEEGEGIHRPETENLEMA